MPGQFNSQDYIPVAERLQQSKDDIQSITVESPTMITDVLGYIRATVATKDGRIAQGTAAFRLDVQGRSAEATDPIEKAETSAIGRALKHVGYGVSREEVERSERNRQPEQERPARTVLRPPQPVTIQTNKQPQVSLAEAEAMYWETFDGPLGGGSLDRVSTLLGKPVSVPQSVEEWRDLYKATNLALQEEAKLKVGQEG